MTISGWIAFGIFGAVILVCGFALSTLADNKVIFALGLVVTLALTVALFFGIRWYFQNTASGQRALIDQQSELTGGLERTVTVYTADGNVLAQYEGCIDIEGNNGGYVLFDFEGKRYMYYNCFIESVADIG